MDVVAEATRARGGLLPRRAKSSEEGVDGAPSVGEALHAARDLGTLLGFGVVPTTAFRRGENR
jgi:hypothetical protein